MKYLVHLTETYAQSWEVEAESSEEAEDKAMAENGVKQRDKTLDLSIDTEELGGD